MKFAIVETGGKQYRIAPGETFEVEKLADTLKEGDKVIFDKVLLIEDEKETQLGDPYIKEAKIEATFEGRAKSKKISVVRFRSKSRYHRKYGHRQIKDTVTVSTK
jgi:large subunit ribosomal protein L21